MVVSLRSYWWSVRRHFAVWSVTVSTALARTVACCLSAHLLSTHLSPAQALDPTELKSEGLLLSLEDQLSALTLSELQNSEPSATVSLNGECFRVELFEDMRESTKVLCRLCSVGQSWTPHMFVHVGTGLGWQKLELLDFNCSHSPSSLTFSFYFTIKTEVR